MSGHAYTEHQLVEQPAIGLFAEVRSARIKRAWPVFRQATPCIPVHLPDSVPELPTIFDASASGTRSKCEGVML